jgi:uridine kinase
VIGICGGASSGKSTVAKMIKSKLKGQPQIINLIDFYLPVRGNMRRKSSLTSDLKEDEETVAKELTEINKNYDFDVPSAIDWDLLIVRILI